MKKVEISIRIVALVALALALAPQAGMADRGGWADPPGGWTFVEEWQDIPQLEDDPDWNHNNGSDSYSGNAHTDLLGQEVTRIDVVEGAGDTEDGETQAADATVFSLIDLGDPRAIDGIDDPSDRKQYFLAPLHEPDFDAFEEQFPGGDPFLNGITFVARFRIFPLPISETVGDGLVIPDTLGPGDTLMNIPEASDRAHIGIGFVDPFVDDFRMIVGCGYFQPDSLQIITNTEDEDNRGSGADNVTFAEGIDNTEFHSVWMTAQANPDNDLEVVVRAYVDGSLEPVEAIVMRGAGSEDRPNPESLQDNAEWAGFRELSINLGSAGTTNIGAFQYDYVAASINGAFEPEAGAWTPGGGTSVHTWNLY